MKNTIRSASLSLGATIIMMQSALAGTPDAATDPRIDPQVRVLLADLNKDSSPFWQYASFE